MDIAGSFQVSCSVLVEEKYRRMGACEKLFCSHKSCPVALGDIICDCICGAICGATRYSNKPPVLSAAPPASEGAAAAAAAGDAK